MPNSVSRQVFDAMDELLFIENSAIADIPVDYSRRNEERDRQVHKLLESALISDKIPKRILEAAYKNFKSLLKGFLLRKFDDQITGVRKRPVLTAEERETIFTIVSRKALIAMRTMIVTIDNDGSNETNQEIEELTGILELRSTNQILMRALFEDAYKDAVLELIRGETEKQIEQIFLLAAE